jgi:hypothetical protein
VLDRSEDSPSPLCKILCRLLCNNKVLQSFENRFSLGEDLDPASPSLGFCRSIGPSSLQCQLEEVEAAAGNGSWTYRQFLRELLEREEVQRRARLVNLPRPVNQELKAF